ncbi:MAG: mannose-1-phosphate guanylyltransferase [Deltaproteobacteria bacterium]|nr:mannose-1-phosphate guanylyltransferase [Deltaproteobacteria bacterium]
MMRDTAAAVTLGAVICRRLFGNPVMAVLTADHFISPVRRFQQVMESAAGCAKRTGALYTIGITTGRAATGYGYLETGKRLEPDGDVQHFQLVRFKEKPEPTTAEQYHADERFYWNSGMFVWTVDSILSEVQAHLPIHSERLFPLGRKFGTSEWTEALQEAFSALPRISIDFGVMEKTKNIRMVKGDFDWDDVGSWSALDRFLAPDSHGNRARGVLHASASENTLVFCEDPSETVAVLGVRDLVVVRSGKRTLVMNRSQAEALKQLVTRMLDPT